VAAIARNIARATRLNEDLAEAIALAHDLGHSPFGHTGEASLNRLMKGHGGFEHNRQSLRVVELLEQKYPRFSGLNLSWEVREGIAKHFTSFDHPEIGASAESKSSSLEAQVANLADEITYYSHDLDDGLTARLLSEKVLNREVKVWAEAARLVKKAQGDLPDESRRYYIIRCLIDQQVRDVVTTSESAIHDARIKSADDARSHPKALVRYSPKRRVLNLELRRYLYKNLYYNPEVHEPNRRAALMLGQLFRYYLENPRALDGQFQRIGRKEGWPRAVCDYLAGMTDRYCAQDYQRLFGLTV
jgi:dGTPase